MAKDNLDNLVEQLKQDVNNYAIHLSREMAHNAQKMLTREAERSIEMFYEHYTPTYYNRHQPEGVNLRRSFRPYYYSPHGKNSKGGVEICVNEMDNMYQQSADYVGDTVWAGFHGPPIGNNVNTPRMWPSPIQRVRDLRDYLRDNIYVIKKPAEKKAKNYYYNLLFKN